MQGGVCHAGSERLSKRVRVRVVRRRSTTGRFLREQHVCDVCDVCVCACVCVFVHVCLFVCVFVHLCVFVHVCVCLCQWLCRWL